MGSYFERFCGSRIEAIEARAFLPTSGGRTPLRKIPGEKFIELVERIAEAAAAAKSFKDDPRMPRYFVRIVGNKGSHTLEIQPEYAYFGEWVYTPGRELWRFLEGIPKLKRPWKPRLRGA